MISPRAWSQRMVRSTARRVWAAVARANDHFIFAILVQVLNQHCRWLSVEDVFPFLDVFAVAHAQTDQLQCGEPGQQRFNDCRC